MAFSTVDCAADPTNPDCAYGTPRTVSPEQYGGALFILGAMLLVQVATFIVTMTRPNLAANRD